MTRDPTADYGLIEAATSTWASGRNELHSHGRDQ